MREIQVKTASTVPSWQVGEKGTERALSDREWYALVQLGWPEERPRCWIVPRDHLAAATWISHMSWLLDPNIAPGTRNAGIDRARLGPEEIANYAERWDLLEFPTPEVPVMLPESMREAVERVGLPEGHPWRDGLPSWIAPPETQPGVGSVPSRRGRRPR